MKEKSFFPVVTNAIVKEKNEMLERHLLSIEKDDANENMPVISLAAARKVRETEQNISAANDEPNELIEDNQKEIEDEISPQSSPFSQSEENVFNNNVLSTPEEEYSCDEPFSTLEEETAPWKNSLRDLRKDLPGEFDVEEDLSSADVKRSSVLDQKESGSFEKETISYDKSDTHVIQEHIEDETLNNISHEELSQSQEDKKTRATALAEEFKESRRLFTEQTGKTRKKYIIWLGVGFISMVTFTIAAVLFFYSGGTDTRIDSYQQKLIALYKNANDLEDKVSISLDSNSINLIEHEHEKSIGIIAINPEGIKTPDETVSDNLERNALSVESGGTSIIPADKIEQDKTQNIIPIESADITIVIVDNAVKEKTESNTKTIGTKKITGRTKIAANETKRTKTVSSVKTDNEQSTWMNNKSFVFPAKSAVEYSTKQNHTAQDNIYDAIRNERYIDAINLSKRNLERNSKDVESFFSLGAAFYASSDFYWATRAFYNCLRFDGANLPDFTVEELDTTESLNNLIFDYPGVDLLVRAVELNPRGKTLYLNLFLSNLKSEESMEISKIYNGILNHAKKYGTNK